jgi:MYXO-CTERM domain-containing protein
MGTSWKEIQEGVLDTGKVIAETMSLWNQATGKTPVPATAQTTIPQTAGSAVGQQVQSASATTAGPIPTWALLALGVGAVLLLSRSKGG